MAPSSGGGSHGKFFSQTMKSYSDSCQDLTLNENNGGSRLEFESSGQLPAKSGTTAHLNAYQ